MYSITGQDHFVDDPSHGPAPDVSQELVDHVAKKLHQCWLTRITKEGWSYGTWEEDKMKDPGAVPYDLISQDDKEILRRTAIKTLSVLSFFGISIDRHPTHPEYSGDADPTLPSQFNEVSEIIARHQHKLEANSALSRTTGIADVGAMRLVVPFDELSSRDQQQYREYAKSILIEAIRLDIGIHPPSLSASRFV